MKKIILIIALFGALASQAQKRLYGNGFYNIRSNRFGWLGTSGTDSVGYIDSAKVKLFKPLMLGSYTTAGRPDATLFPGAIIYNSDSTFHQYSNGTAWFNVPGTGGGGGGGGVTGFTDGSGFDGTVSGSNLSLTTSLTTGSIPYIGASGALTQNNSNLFWDNSNIRLGIGTSSPSERLHIVRSVDALALAQFSNTNAGVSAGGGFKFTTDGGDAYIYRTSIAYVSSLGDDFVFQEAGGGDMVWFTANEKMRLLNNGNLGLGLNAPSNVLDILHASQPQLRLTTTATTSYTTLQGSGGNLYLNGNSVTNTMIALGGSTSSFPGLQRNAANLRARLADNSANTDFEVADEAYDATAWNGSVEVPTKNAIRDKIESMTGGGITSINSQTGPAITIAAGTGISVNNTTNTVTISTNTSYITSGTYTPTLTNTANVSASVASACQYMRIGNVVHVSGMVQIDATSATTVTELGISLPVSSDFVEEFECAGTTTTTYSGGNESGNIRGDVTNNRALIRFYSTSTDNQSWYFTFTYTVAGGS